MKLTVLLFIVCLSGSLFAQTEIKPDFFEKRNSLTLGFLQGGGSIIGADLEFLITNRFGVQIGAGFVGFGAGINYHLQPSIRSSFISLQYWNQGTGDSFAQNAIGPSFVYRGKKWFTFQIGLAKTLSLGPAMPNDYKQPPVLLLYAIGVYLPV